MRPSEILGSEEELFEDSGVELAYLFGSFAEGRADDVSDVDVAVLFRDFSGLNQVFEFEKKLQNLFEIKVDVLCLNTADLRLRKEVVENGRPVYVEDDERRVDFETRVFSRFMDMKPYFERYSRKRSERLEALKS